MKAMLVKHSWRVVAGVVLLLGQVVATELTAQIAVQGRVIDRLFTEQPLAGAVVRLEGSPQSAVSDAEGRFSLEGLQPGAYTALVSHPRFEDIGVQLPAMRFVVTDGATPVDLSTPSADELLARICPPDIADAPVFGAAIVRVRNVEDGQPAGGARVRVAWTETQLDAAGRRLGYRVLPQEVLAVADDAGRALVCGIPRGVPLTFGADDGRRAAGPFRDSTTATRLLGSEIFVGRAAPDAVVVGQIVGEDGAVISGATVRLLGASTLATSGEGGFRLPVTEAGTQSLEVRAIGFGESSHRITVQPGRTTLPPIVISPMAFRLQELRVTADATGFERRRQSIDGHYLTADDIARMQPTRSEDIVRLATGALMTDGFARPAYVLLNGGRCVPRVFFDGREIDGSDYVTTTEQAHIGNPQVGFFQAVAHQQPYSWFSTQVTTYRPERRYDLPLRFDPQDIRGVEIYDASRPVPPEVASQLFVRGNSRTPLRGGCAILFWSWFSGAR